MKRKKIRFKREVLSVDGISNIPILVICSGHGYDFDTYCCCNCGELFVVELEALYHWKSDIKRISVGKSCPKCNSELEQNLIKYPEYIFYNGIILKNNQAVDYFHFENTELLEFFVPT